jgi:hypothetical protein
MEELIKLWTAVDTTKSISQIIDTETFIYNKFFSKTKKCTSANKMEIPIKRGSGIILTSVSPVAEHLVQDRGDTYLLNLTMPRFPLQASISAAEINDMKSFDATDRKEELGRAIGERQAEHKSSFNTTLEYMSAGALFGKIMDGDGKILFEFKGKDDTVEFKSDADPILAFRAIDKKIAKELGKNSETYPKCCV